MNVICQLQLRQSLINEENETGRTFLNSEADNDDNEFDNGFPDFDMPGNDFMDEEDQHPFDKEVNI